MTCARPADALAAKGGAYLGVALVPTTISDAELRALDAQGYRGARFHYVAHLGHGPPIDEVIAFGRRLAPLGWHLQLHMAAERIGELAPAIRRSPVPVMIDHMGRVDASRGLAQQPFRDLLALLADKNVWVKVSGADRLTRQDPRIGPPYADAVPFARKLVAEFGDRCVWGTDWPHPNHEPPVPDDGLLVDLLAEIAPGAALQAVLVDNPQPLLRLQNGEQQTHARPPAGPHRHHHRRRQRRPRLGQRPRHRVRFAEEGAKIFAVDRDPDSTAETVDKVKAVGGEIVVHECDVTDSAAVNAMAEGLPRPLRPHRHAGQQCRRLGAGRAGRDVGRRLGRADRLRTSTASSSAASMCCR